MYKTKYLDFKNESCNQDILFAHNSHAGYASFSAESCRYIARYILEIMYYSLEFAILIAIYLVL